MGPKKDKKAVEASPSSKAQINSDDDDVSPHISTSYTTTTQASTYTPPDVQKLMSDFDTRLQNQQKVFLDAINNLCMTFGQAHVGAAAGAGAGPLPPGGPPNPAGAVRRAHERPINVSGLEQMAHDISLLDFSTWKAKWDDFVKVNHVGSYPRDQQVSALRMALSTQMLQTVEMVLGIDASTTLSPAEILTEIQQHIRSKRSVVLDRVNFEECRQTTKETFDEFYIRLQRVAGCADLCAHCRDDRLTTRIITGILDQEARKKLLAMPTFPTLKQAVDLCRAEEAASFNEPMLRGASGVNKVTSKTESNIKDVYWKIIF